MTGRDEGGAADTLAAALGDGRAAAEDLDRLMRGVGASARGISAALSTGLRQALVDGRALDQVLRGLALSLSRRVLEAALAPIETGIARGVTGLVGTLVTGLGGGLGGGLGTGLGGGLAGAARAGVVPGPVTAFAKGGVVASPGYFPLGRGTGLVGEAGAEAILPLQRDARGRLGVAAGGIGGGEAGLPAIVFNVEARDADSFARSETQIATMVARAVGRGRRGL